MSKREKVVSRNIVHQWRRGTVVSDTIINSNVHLESKQKLRNSRCVVESFAAHPNSTSHVGVETRGIIHAAQSGDSIAQPRIHILYLENGVSFDFRGQTCMGHRRTLNERKLVGLQVHFLVQSFRRLGSQPFSPKSSQHTDIDLPAPQQEGGASSKSEGKEQLDMSRVRQ